jgi:heme exporter protein A
MTSLLLEASGVSFSRADQPILDRLSFRLEAGSLVRLSGRNGAGKSTLLKLLAGLLEPDQGEIRCYAPIAWLGDRNGLKLPWSALENLEFLADLRPRNRQNSLKALDQFGLFAQRHQPVSGFSQGMKRRLALASLSLTSAPVWLLDEPQASLDPTGVVLFENLLAQHLEQGGCAIVASHYDWSVLSKPYQTLLLGED